MVDLVFVILTRKKNLLNQKCFFLLLIGRLFLSGSTLFWVRSEENLMNKNCHESSMKIAHTEPYLTYNHFDTISLFPACANEIFRNARNKLNFARIAHLYVPNSTKQPFFTLSRFKKRRSIDRSRYITWNFPGKRFFF